MAPFSHPLSLTFLPSIALEMTMLITSTKLLKRDIFDSLMLVNRSTKDTINNNTKVIIKARAKPFSQYL